MFNFTTQTVYNNIVVDEITTKGLHVNKDANLIVYSVQGTKPSVRIGNTRFSNDNIEDFQVKLPTEPNLAKVTFDLSKVYNKIPDCETEITARICLYIGLSMNSLDSFYANPYFFKGKPFFIEFPIKKQDLGDGENPTGLAEPVRKIVEKYFLLMTNEKILEVTANGNELTIKGTNGYQQIKKAVLLWYNPDAKSVDCCTNQGDYEDVVVGVPVTYTTNANGVITATGKVFDGTDNGRNLEGNEVAIIPGLEAFGDYNWIIHNLRLPTAANYYPWSPANRMGEMPVPGQEYTQFIIRLKTERDGIMGEIVGARGTSVTTHVFYVAGRYTQASPAKDFYDNVVPALNLTVNNDNKVADTHLQTPFA